MTVKNVGTADTRVEHSSNNGSYLITNLKPAQYQVSIEASGLHDVYFPG